MNIQTQILRTARKLISFHSTADDPEALEGIVAYVAGLLEGTDLRVRKLVYNDVPSLLITSHNTAKPDILLNGHLDVVEGYPEQFEAFVKDGYLYGRGSVDMKLFNAVALQVMLDMHAEQPDLSIGCYFSCDEESGGHQGAREFIRAGYAAKLLINGDAGVDYTLVTGSKGILRFTMTADTHPGRPAYPWEGVNAAQVLIDAFNRIQSRFPGSQDASAEDNWHTTYSISKLNTEQHPSGLPFRASMTLGINFVDDISYDQLFDELQELVPECHLVQVNVAERLEVDHEGEVYQRFLDIAKQHFQQPFQVKKDNGSSDAKFFKHAADHIIIVKMPGCGAHEPAERALLDGILPMYNTLMDLCRSEVQELAIETIQGAYEE